MQPLNESLYAAGTWEGFGLTHTGTLIGGVELSGIDPQGKGPADFENITRLLRNILQNLHPSVIVTQYYWHYMGGTHVQLKNRNYARSRLLNERRQAMMDDRGFASARLFWLIEVPSTEALNKFLSIAFLKALFEMPFSSVARDRLKAKLSHKDAWLVEERELFRQVELLTKELADLNAKLEVLARDRTALKRPHLWALNRALVNMQPKYLDSALTEEIPLDHWDSQLADGDCNPVTLDELPALKFDGATPVYARIASVIGFGEKHVPEGVWAKERMRPVGQRGNYLIVTRYTPMSRLGRGQMISGKTNELHRSQVKLGSILSGKGGSEAIENKINASESLKKMVAELDEAEVTSDRYWYSHSHLVVFGPTADDIRSTSMSLDTAMSQSGIRVVWESAALLNLFPMLLPGYPKKCWRSSELTSTQAGATAMIYKPHIGKVEWGFAKEEAIFVFESDDGSPFHFTPYIGDKCLSLGVGPTRSGKTFMKNVLASHFMKFQSLYHSIGVDQGDEPTARFFGEDGGIFRLENGSAGRGFNPFVAAHDLDDGGIDTQFANHMLTQIRMMLSLNDSEALKHLEPHEQEEVDNAIISVLQLPKHMRSFTRLEQHCSKPIKQKLNRWLRGNLYGNFFDNDVDGVGALDKRFAAYNLGAVKDMPDLAKLAMNEIFFRVIRLFEDPAFRTVPKLLSIDEAQYVLSVPGVADLAIAKARTWFKHGGGMEFWTQSPEHYMKLKEWETLRSSATTYWFLADQEMNREMYRQGFHLSEGELDAIANLIPRQQAFIVQREIGVAKVVNLRTTPEEYVLATSNPIEAPRVAAALDKYTDIDEAIRHAVAEVAALRK